MNILGELLKGPATNRELEERLDSGRSTIRRNTKILQEDGWVERENGSLRIKPQRRFLLEPLLRASEIFDVYWDEESYWRSHDLSPIPRDLLLDLGDLAGGRVVSGTPANPLLPLREKKRIIRESSRILIVTPAYLPEYEEIAVSILEEGVEAEVMMTQEAYDAFELRSHTVSRDAVSEAENVRVLILDAPLGYGLTVGDSGMSLTLHRMDGSFDLSSSYVAEGKRAVEWGRRLFRCSARSSREM